MIIINFLFLIIETHLKPNQSCIQTNLLFKTILFHLVKSILPQGKLLHIF